MSSKNTCSMPAPGAAYCCYMRLENIEGINYDKQTKLDTC